MHMPKVPISIGELFDKISILEIKLHYIKDDKKLKNINTELQELYKIVEEIPVLIPMELKEINLKLWHIEDRIREKEKLQEFDKEFIELARSVYRTNDIRSSIKKDINLKTNSLFIEEKSYEGDIV